MTAVDAQENRSHAAAVLAAVRSGAVTTKAPLAAMAFDHAKVYTATSQGTGPTSVTVPVSGGYSTISNLTVVRTEDGSIEQSGETLISRNAAGNVAIATYAGGALTRTSDTGRPYVTNAQLAAGDVAAQTQVAQTQAAPMGVGKTVACVATVLGVSGATAHLIVGACPGACTIPVVGTAICVACIGAYAAVGGASITADGTPHTTLVIVVACVAVACGAVTRCFRPRPE